MRINWFTRFIGWLQGAKFHVGDRVIGLYNPHRKGKIIKLVYGSGITYWYLVDNCENKIEFDWFVSDEKWVLESDVDALKRLPPLPSDINPPLHKPMCK